MPAKSTSRNNPKISKKTSGKISGNDTVSCSCGRAIIPPSGPQNAEILIIGEFPGKEEEKRGQPFVGPAGGVLRGELYKVGINMNTCRITNLALHQDPQDVCYTFGLEQAIREAHKRKAILLMGSECSRVFIGKPVTSISGLMVKSKYLDAPIIIATVNPAAVISGTIGEFRLAVQKFAKALSKGRKKC